MKIFHLSALLLSVFLGGLLQHANAQSSGVISAVLEGGMLKEGTMSFPRGPIQIMSKMAEEMERPNPAQQKYGMASLESFQRYEKAGFLTIAEERRSPLESIRDMGARSFTVSPTNKLLQIQDPKLSSGTFAVIQAETYKVTNIIKNEEYKPPVGSGSPGDEFRLILGVILQSTTEQGKVIYGAIGYYPQPRQRKFRAILQFNPFAKTYSFVTADLGDPASADWFSQNVK